MPLDLAKVRDRTARAPFTFGDDTGEAVYSTGYITPQWLDIAFQLPLRDVLAQILVSWDITDDGQPLVPTDEAIREAVVAARLTDAGTSGAALGEAARKKLATQPPSAAERRLAQITCWQAILGALPKELLDAVFDGIWTHMFPSKKSSGDSGAS